MLITIDDAVTHLAKGEVVALPTETVYGLAGLALKKASVQKIYSLKGRPSTNPLIVHVADIRAAEELAIFNDRARHTASVFWPGPLTLVLAKKKPVPDLVTADNHTVALRIPNHWVFLEILNRLGKPLAAPSANPSNRTSPTEAGHVRELFGQQCPPIVDGGKCSVGLESTVLDLSGQYPVILRPGLITRAQLEESLGEKIKIHSVLSETVAKNEPKLESAPSPGMLPLHYAPITPLKLYSSVEEFLAPGDFSPEDCVVVSNEKDGNILLAHGYTCSSLSADGCPQKIAQNLYGTLIELDAKKHKSIHLIFTGETRGINRAIWDRLDRAKTR